MKHPIQDWFDTRLAPLHLLRHPFYRDWMEGKLSQAELKDYALQYSSHVESFPRYLSALHSRCSDSRWRRILLENLNDEEGLTQGKPHPDLWRQFAASLGATMEEIRAVKPREAISNVTRVFFQAGESSAHEGLGALYAYEAQVPEIARSKIEGLETRYGIHSPEALEFFRVHEQADVYHREALVKLLAELPEKEREEAADAAERAAQCLWDFLSDVHRGGSCDGNGGESLASA